MYEAVTVYPDADSTLSRFSVTATRYGFDGLVVRNADRVSSAIEEFDRNEPEFERVDIVTGIEIEPQTKQDLSAAVRSNRNDHTILIVRGGDRTINRAAVENPKVDVLSDPMSGSGDVNHVIAKAAADNGVHLEFSFDRVLRASGGYRVRAIQSLRKLRELVDQYGSPFVVSSMASSHLHLRTPRDLAAVGVQVGFSEEHVRNGLAAWGALADRNRDIRSDSYIEHEVERSHDETTR